MPFRSPPGSYLVLETTNRCSLACVHCTVAAGPAHPHHARTGFLPLPTAEAVFADLAAVGARFDTLLPFWLGEPLLHPDFVALHQAALRVAPAVFGRIEVHTNATHLDARTVRAVLNASPVPQVWHLSLDAATRETYRRVKGVDAFDTVDAHVDAFLRARAGRRPRPVLQFIVGENNVAEVPLFRRRWAERLERLRVPFRVAAQHVPPGDDAVIFFRQLDAPTPVLQERANAAMRAAMAREGIELPAPDRTPTSVGRGPGVCACWWKSPVIGWDGSVTACTRDNRLQNVLGNVLHTPLSQLWWGPDAAARRRRVASGDYTGLAACQGCFIPRSANYTDITPEEVAACT